MRCSSRTVFWALLRESTVSSNENDRIFYGCPHPRDYRHALRMLADKDVNAVELSALRQEELRPLVEDLENLDLRKFQYIAFHAPSSLHSKEQLSSC